jgi:hypothetical protein
MAMEMDTGTFTAVLAGAVAVLGLFIWFKFRASDKKTP